MLELTISRIYTNYEHDPVITTCFLYLPLQFLTSCNFWEFARTCFEII